MSGDHVWKIYHIIIGMGQDERRHRCNGAPLN